jgi:transcriptional regulator with XRE-family HTH domain
MDLAAVGALVAARRRAEGLTLAELASRAAVGRSTLAAFESGKLPELGFERVARICAAVDLVIDVRAPLLDAPIVPHRHLTEAAGRELTKAAIDDIIVRGDVAAWRKLFKSMRDDTSGRTSRRVREVAAAIADQDVKAKAFAALLPRVSVTSRRVARRRR